MKKRVLAIVLTSLVIIMGLSSCGKKEETASAPEPGAESQSEAEAEAEPEPAVVTEEVKLKIEELGGWKFSVPESWNATDKIDQYAHYQIDEKNSLNVTIFGNSMLASGMSLEDFAKLNAGEEGSAPVKEEGMPYETYSMNGKMTGGIYTSNYFINGDGKGVLWLSILSNEENPSCLADLKNTAASVDASGVVAPSSPEVKEPEDSEEAPAADAEEKDVLDDNSGTDDSASNSDDASAEEESDKQGIETTQLYKDFFEPYAKGVGSLLLNGFQSSAEEKLGNYKTEITEGNEEDQWQYKVYDDSGEYVVLMFYPDNVDDPDAGNWIWSLSLLTYERPEEKEISISDGYHLYSPPKYSTWQADRDPKNKDANNIDELEKFMFED